MDMSLILRCHTCNRIPRDRRGYRDHLLRKHNEVPRRGFDVPVVHEGRELAAVWAGVRCHQVSGTTLAARRREELGLPRVSDREAERRFQDNWARSTRRHRAAARARGAARATLGTPDATATETQGAVPLEPVGRLASRRPISPCQQCLHCECQQHRDFSAAQDDQPPTPGRSSHSRRRSSSSGRQSTPRHPPSCSPKRDPSPGPPQLSREPDHPEAKAEGVLSWADAQEQFSLGAETMSQGFGSPSPSWTQARATTSSPTSEARTARCRISAASRANRGRPLQYWSWR